MPGSTPDLGIPYALATDPLSDWPNVNQELSEKIEEQMLAVVIPQVGVVTADGIAGNGADVAPVVLSAKYGWGGGPVGGAGGEAPDLRLWGTDSLIGDPVYVDAEGFVRSMPQVIPDAQSHVMADPPSTYPQGMSIMSIYSSTAASGGWPDGSSCTVVTYRRHGDTDVDAVVHQWWYATAPANTRVMTRFGGTAGWSAWRSIPMSYEDIPASSNLNNYIYPGQYPQPTNANAMTALNYPVAASGLLEVGRSSTGTMVWQRYTVYGSTGLGTNLTYTRNLNGSTWSAWVYLPKADKTVAEITNAFTAASGWSIISQYLYRVQSNIMACSLSLRRTGVAIGVGDNGDTGNIDLATMSSSYPAPLMHSCGLATIDSGRVTGALINSARKIRLGSVGGISDIATGDDLSVGGMFPVVVP